MSYKEAMEIVSNGGHVQRKSMMRFDVYIRKEDDLIVNTTYEGYTASEYKPTEEDKVADDWKII